MKVIIKNIDREALTKARLCANMRCGNFTQTLATLEINKGIDEFMIPLCYECLNNYKEI